MGTLQAGWKIGCYELIRLLGEGGMGEVWLAHDGPADRSVALKFIKPHLLNNPGMRTRFTNEARTLGKLEQDRIVTLYTVVEEGEHLAFVLRFIEGHSLADRIESQYPLPMNFVLSSARDILAALGEAHQRGIIHRDIKPQNILIDLKDRSFLTDFGIAVTDFLERATVGAFAIGTPHYMSPEQITRPRDITIALGGQRTDIYSYGVVLYEMLTGRVPFGQDSGAEEIYTIQQAHCQEAPPMLRSFNGAISPAMEDVVLHCLEKNPDHRPQNCAELLEEIEAAARGSVPKRSPMGTVFESTPVRQTAVAYPSTPIVQQLQPQPQVETGSRKRSALQKNMVLAIAALVLVGGLGFTLYLMSGRHNQSATPEAVQPVQQPLVTGSPGKEKQTAPASNIGKTGMASHIPPGSPTAAPPDNTTVHNSSAPTVAPSGGGQDADAKQAAGLASQADKEYKAGEYCQALSTLNDAIALHNDPKYAGLRSKYTTACNAQ